MKVLPHNLNKETPVISLTANAVSGARAEYMQAGFQDYLTKPIDSKKLEHLLLELLPSQKIELVSEENKETSPKTDVPSAQGSLSPASDSIPPELLALKGVTIQEGITNCGSADVYKEVAKGFFDAIDENAASIINYMIDVDTLKLDELDKRREKINKVTKEEIVNLSKKIKIQNIYLLEGVKND